MSAEKSMRTTMLYVLSSGKRMARLWISRMMRLRHGAFGGGRWPAAASSHRSPAALRTCSQKSANSGCSKRALGRIALPPAALRRLQTSAASSECPPRWKK